MEDSCEDQNGIIEVKCPFSKQSCSIEEACQDRSFFCEMVDSKMQLKTTHIYYHQVQLQIYVGADLYKWCDFCVYTHKGVAIQHILPNIKWQEGCIPQL